MELKVNQKLFTRDGRKVGNCYIALVSDKNKNTHVMDCTGDIHMFSSDELKDTFFIDEINNDEKIYNEIISLTNEAGMTFSLLRSICSEKMNKTIEV